MGDPAMPVRAGSRTQDNPEAASKFQDVNKAYEVLRDPQKRQQYDQLGAQAFEQAASMGGGEPGAGGFGGFGGGFQQAGCPAARVDCISAAVALQCGALPLSEPC